MLFWANIKQTLPTWFTVVSDVVLLLQPSSAFMERVFSILRCCFSERQEQANGDRISGSVMLTYEPCEGQGWSSLEGGWKHRQWMVKVEVQHI